MPRLIIPFRVDLYPYVRTTQKQMFKDPNYHKYDNAKKQIRAATVDALSRAGLDMMPKVPLRMALFVNVPGRLHGRDLSNVLKGVEDGAQHAAYDNDAWIDQIVASRHLVEDREQYVLMIVQPISEGPARFSKWHVEVEDLAIEWGLFV